MKKRRQEEEEEPSSSASGCQSSLLTAHDGQSCKARFNNNKNPAGPYELVSIRTGHNSTNSQFTQVQTSQTSEPKRASRDLRAASSRMHLLY